VKTESAMPTNPTHPTGSKRGDMKPTSRTIGRGWLAVSADWSTPLLLSGIVLMAVALMSVLGFGRTGVEALIMLVAVVGLHAYSGVTGIATFGHVGFMAIGGYVATLLTLPAVVKSYRLPGLPAWLAGTEMDPYLALVVVYACGVVAAGVFGLLIWRLNGLAAGISTLAFLLVTYNVTSGWEDVTGGRGAVPGVPQISDTAPALVVALLAIWATAWFGRTRQVRMARAAREDEAAAHAIGIRVHLGRWVAMTFSGGVMALAGGLYVYFVGSISPDFFYVPMMFSLLTFLVVGGMTSLTGAVVGTLAVQLLRQLLEPLDRGWDVAGIAFDGRPGLRFVVLGLLTLLVLAKRPGGLVNGFEIRLPMRRKGSHAEQSAQAATTTSVSLANNSALQR
jgi:branched-chain amino acid transport system permease protein